MVYLPEVCDEVLNDKKVKLDKRLERAQALVLIAEIFNKVSFHITIIEARPYRIYMHTSH